MIRKIDIDIFSKSDLVEKYNDEVVSRDLINYILEKTTLLRKEEKIKIVFHKSKEVNNDCKRILLNGLQEEYHKSLIMKRFINIKEVILFVVGLIFIFASTKADNLIIGKEILLISGWVPIWEVIEMELIEESKERRKRKALKRLLNSEITEELIKE